MILLITSFYLLIVSNMFYLEQTFYFFVMIYSWVIDNTTRVLLKKLLRYYVKYLSCDDKISRYYFNINNDESCSESVEKTYPNFTYNRLKSDVMWRLCRRPTWK